MCVNLKWLAATYFHACVVLYSPYIQCLLIMYDVRTYLVPPTVRVLCVGLERGWLEGR